MDEQDRLAERFEAHRSHLQGVAYRMLGARSEADDAVQETWLRFNRTDTSNVENLGGWLTTVMARVCLNILRSRRSRREEPLRPPAVDPVASGDYGIDPEDEALLADSVGLALLVVLDRLGPAERIAFVLHDMFAVPFDEIAPIVERTPTAAKKLASRARQRVKGTVTIPAADLTQHRRVVEAFLSASRGGDVNALLAVLDPDVVRRADHVALPVGAAPEVRGARVVAEETRSNAKRARLARPALIDGALGLVVAPRGRLVVALALEITDGKITAIDVIADPDRLRQLDLAVLDI
jgi:RNA polymerase sigma-70 factor (ECF subfamily)